MSNDTDTVYDVLKRVIGPHSDVDIPALGDKVAAMAHRHKDFVLHEDTGEPDSNAKTDELHAFLEPLCGPHTPHDFDGSNEGLQIWLTAKPGDTIRLYEDGAVLVVPKVEKL